MSASQLSCITLCFLFCLSSKPLQISVLHKEGFSSTTIPGEWKRSRMNVRRQESSWGGVVCHVVMGRCLFGFAVTMEASYCHMTEPCRNLSLLPSTNTTHSESIPLPSHWIVEEVLGIVWRGLYKSFCMASPGFICQQIKTFNVYNWISLFWWVYSCCVNLLLK